MTIRSGESVTGVAVLLLLASCALPLSTNRPKTTPLPLPPVVMAEQPLSCSPPNCMVISRTGSSRCEPVYYEEGDGTTKGWRAAECRPPSPTDDPLFGNEPVRLISTSLVDPKTIRSTIWTPCGYDGEFASVKQARPLECRLDPQRHQFEWRYSKERRLSKPIAEMKRKDEKQWRESHPVEHLCGTGQIDGYSGQIGSLLQTCEGRTIYLPNELNGDP
jgi:hypothetical protein